jgi:hypothetical protein
MTHIIKYITKLTTKYNKIYYKYIKQCIKMHYKINKMHMNNYIRTGANGSFVSTRPGFKSDWWK